MVRVGQVIGCSHGVTGSVNSTCGRGSWYAATKRKAHAAHRGSGWDEAGYAAFTYTNGQSHQHLNVIQKSTCGTRSQSGSGFLPFHNRAHPCTDDAEIHTACHMWAGVGASGVGSSTGTLPPTPLILERMWHGIRCVRGHGSH